MAAAAFLAASAAASFLRFSIIYSNRISSPKFKKEKKKLTQLEDSAAFLAAPTGSLFRKAMVSSSGQASPLMTAGRLEIRSIQASTRGNSLISTPAHSRQCHQ